VSSGRQKKHHGTKQFRDKGHLTQLNPLRKGRKNLAKFLPVSKRFLIVIKSRDLYLLLILYVETETVGLEVYNGTVWLGIDKPA
jgi:hypothetical protein